MKKFFYLFILIFSLSASLSAKANIMILKLTYGDVEIELYPEKAPNHVKRFKELADSGKYDGVVFHRVIDGFMAQTGDVKFGNTNSPDFNLSLAGTGGSDLPNLKAEFTDMVDFYVDEPLGGNTQPSVIKDAATGKVFRG